MKIQSVLDESFRAYGRVLKGYEISELMEKMKNQPCPCDQVVYVPSVPELEDTEEAAAFRDYGFGGLPVQIGYCNGWNRSLNALEYHRCSEIDIAVTDLIMLVGRQQDVQDDGTYDTGNVEAFLVPAETAVELYATTLHYAPCVSDGQGFRCVIILPEGTNTPAPEVSVREGENRLLAARNKWLMAHPDAEIPDAFPGLKGENITI